MADWGNKQVCPTCGAKFYDLGRRQCVCPKCRFEFVAAESDRVEEDIQAPHVTATVEAFEANDVRSPCAVQLRQDVSVCEALGAFTVLFREGQVLPARANIKVNYSPAAGANNSISFFSGQRPLGAAIYKSGMPATADIARVLDVTVVLDQHGCFTAHAAPTDGNGQFLVFCATIDTPHTTAHSGVDRVVVNIPDTHVSLHASALGQAVEGTKLNAFAGFTVDGEVLECAFDPMTALPASIMIEPWCLGDDRRIGLLLIDVADLDQDEREEIEETSQLTLIDDDRDNAICFRVREDVERLRLTMRAGGEFKLEAMNEHGTVELVGEFGFPLAEEQSNEPELESVRASEANGPTAEFEPERPGEELFSSEASELGVETEPDPVDELDSSEASEPGVETGPDPVDELSREADEPGAVSEPNQRVDELLSPLTEGQDSRLFISHHTNRDGKFASFLVRQLEERGVRCWIASRDLRAGANWNRSIMKAVSECEVMVVVISVASIESEYVQAEVHRALNLKKRVVPLLLEEGLPYTDLDARLETKQRIDWWK